MEELARLQEERKSLATDTTKEGYERYVELDRKIDLLLGNKPFDWRPYDEIEKYEPLTEEDKELYYLEKSWGVDLYENRM